MSIWAKLPVPPSQGPSQGNGGGPAVDLFRRENMELQDVGSRLVAPTSLEPHGVELRLEAALQVCALVLSQAVGSRDSGAFPMTRLPGCPLSLFGLA